MAKQSNVWFEVFKNGIDHVPLYSLLKRSAYYKQGIHTENVWVFVKEKVPSLCFADQFLSISAVALQSRQILEAAVGPWAYPSPCRFSVGLSRITWLLFCIQGITDEVNSGESDLCQKTIFLEKEKFTWFYHTICSSFIWLYGVEYVFTKVEDTFFLPFHDKFP